MNGLPKIPMPETFDGESIRIGEFTISDYIPGSFWIEHESGEGMQVSRILLEEAIRKFYADNF